MFVYYKLYKKPVSPMISTNQYLISQPLSSQPQPAPHKHETEVAHPQYLLHWQHLIPQNQIFAVYLPQSRRKKCSACFPTLIQSTESVR